MEVYLKQGLISDSKVLDIRQVDISQGKILENDVPVFVITFTTQEMLIFRNSKTREVVIGAENKVDQCHYAAVITRAEEELDNELTGGWKIVEVRCFLRPLILERHTNFCIRWPDGRLVHTCNLIRVVLVAYKSMYPSKFLGPVVIAALPSSPLRYIIQQVHHYI